MSSLKTILKVIKNLKRPRKLYFPDLMSDVVSIDPMFIYLATYNRLYKLSALNGEHLKSIDLRGLRPYFIANGDFLYGIVNDARRIIIYNRELEKIRDFYYDDNYNKIFYYHTWFPNKS